MKQWYAVHTYAGQEDKVQQNIEKRSEAVGLHTRISRVIVPTEEVKSLRGGKTVTLKKKIFPGYVLVEMDMDDETWHFIRQTVGVTGFLGQVTGTASRPAPLQPGEVERFIGGAGEETGTADDGDLPQGRSRQRHGGAVRRLRRADHRDRSQDGEIDGRTIQLCSGARCRLIWIS